MWKFNQFLGYVFEGAFKAGFIAEKVSKEDYRNFTESFYEKLKEEYINRFPEEGYDQKVFSFLEAVLEKVPYHDPPEETKLRGLRIDEENAKEFYTKMAFNLGYRAGYFFGQDVKNVELKKFHVGEESSRAVWGNADLLFLEGKKLYVIDFKAAGFVGILRDIISKVALGGEVYIPFRNYGASIHLSLGYPRLEYLVKSILSQEDAFLRVEEVSVEMPGIAQLCIYASDFICEEDVQVEEVNLAIYYPFQESFASRLKVKDKEFLQKHLDKLRRLYAILRGKKPILADLTVQAGANLQRVWEDLQKRMEKFRREVERRREKPVVLSVGEINQVRSDVQEKVSHFAKSKEAGILVLLHSAGSGKTSNIRRAIIKSPGNHVIIYLASRLALVDREFKEVAREYGIEAGKGKKWEVGDAVGYLVEKEDWDSEKKFRHEWNSFSRTSKPLGNLGRAVELVCRSQGEYSKIWVFSTLQSVINVNFGGSTSRHLWKLANAYTIDNYQVNIVLDEFFGHGNGLFAIKEVCEFAREFAQSGGKIKVYLLDANGFTPELMNGLLKEFDLYQVVPDGIILCDYRNSMQWKYMDLPLYAYAKHGFPAKGLVVYQEFLQVDEDSYEEAIAEYVAQTFKDKQGSSAFLFLQNKERLVNLSRALKKLGYSSLICTSTSRKSQDMIAKGDEDVILGTSSVARGLDFKRPHKPVDYIYIVLNGFKVEANLVEVLQAISRARGDEKTENRVKHLHLIFLSESPKDYQIENLMHQLGQTDEQLVRLAWEVKALKNQLDLADVVLNMVRAFISGKEKQVLVPIPAQHETSFSHNKISQLERVMTYLTDLEVMEEAENERESRILIGRLRSIIERSVYVYTEDVWKNSDVEYYHPYLLIKKAKVYFAFDTKLRDKALQLCKKLKPVFDKHNPAIFKEIFDFISNTPPLEAYTIPVLLPIYSVVFTEQVLREEDGFMRFSIARRVGRGGASVLGGAVGLTTRCTGGGKVKEYACIPLGEDYPYVEVLSGRFVRLPIEFVKAFWEVNDGVLS